MADLRNDVFDSLVEGREEVEMEGNAGQVCGVAKRGCEAKSMGQPHVTQGQCIPRKALVVESVTYKPQKV